MTRTARLLEKIRSRPSAAFRKAAGSPGTRLSSQFADKALVAAFLVLISIPLLGMVFGFDRSFVLEENRILATWPELKPARHVPGAFPARFEAYFNDQFGFRKRLIYWLALVKVQGLHVTSTPGVTLGREGWLYLASDAAVSSFRATRPFTPGQLETYRLILEERSDWLAARGIPYVLVIAPNKDTIYPEFMAPAYNKVSAGSRLAQLVDYMSSHSKVTIRDVRDDLRQAKRVERIYDMTDSHWNLRGGYIAYARIMQALNVYFPQAKAIPRSDFLDVSKSGAGGDLAKMLGIAQELPEKRFTLVPRNGWHFHHTDEAFPIAARCAHPELTMATERTDAKLPRAVLFRDSFAAQLIPFLAEHFERMLCIWDSAFDRAIIERERPGVVIQEIVERALEGALPIDR
jgi:alginate O-acetyltransferase complex protein AlgJ